MNLNVMELPDLRDTYTERDWKQYNEVKRMVESAISRLSCTHPCEICIKNLLK